MESPGIGRESFQVVLNTQWKHFSTADRPLKVLIGENQINYVYKIQKIKGHRRLIHVGYSHTVKIIE